MWFLWTVAAVVYLFTLGFFLAVTWRRRAILRELERCLERILLPGQDEVDLTETLRIHGQPSRTGPWRSINDILQHLRGILNTAIVKLQSVAIDIYGFDRGFRHFSEVFDSVNQNVISGQKSMECVQESCRTQEETVCGVSEMSATLYSLVEELTAVSTDISHQAELGMTDMRSMEHNISGINEDMQSMVGVSEELNKKAETVRAVVGSITAIAEQTNLLALNASIEAARAGEAGRGFAVVAEEVRTLADESKRAVSRISTTLEELVNDVNQSMQNTKSVSQKVDSSVNEIDRVSEAITAILENVGTVSRSTEEVSKTAENLSHASANLDASSKTLVEQSDGAMAQFMKIEHEIEGLLAQAHSTTEKMQGTSQVGESLIRQLATIRTNDDAEFATVARAAEEAHKNFVANLRKGIESGVYFDLEGNPNRCKLGVFFNLMPKPSCIDARLWNETIATHEKFHPLYHKVLDAVMMGNSGEAMRHYKEAEQLSYKIIQNLHLMMAACESS